jgi:glycosyltransferase involved in cell wall biosynthesis
MTAPQRHLCWIVINSVPYHEARLRVAAARTGLRLCMVQLAGRDVFQVLESSVGTGEGYEQRVLFPDKRWHEIDGRAMARRLQELLSELKPEAVCINGWSYGGCIAALDWCVANRVPAIIMSESTLHDHARRPWKEAIKRRIIGLCSASLVGGTLHRDYIAQLGAPVEQVFTGYDAVDNDHFQLGADRARGAGWNLREALGLPQHYFMACSRFTEKKNLGRLIQAYARYRKNAGGLAWSLVIVGDGELKGELLALRDGLGLKHHVYFPGSVSYPELPSYYGLAEAFIHASTTEQWGLVVNEAMASGLPVLVSRFCGCAPDLVLPGFNGLQFDPLDVESIAQAMVEMAGSSDCDTMGRNSRAVVARWSLTRFAEGLNGAVTAALRAPAANPGWADRLMLRAMRHR